MEIKGFREKGENREVESTSRADEVTGKYEKKRERVRVGEMRGEERE